MSEGNPEDIIRWTEGKALIATGSPFEPVNYGGRFIKISQGNNVYVFPGVGLGAIISGAKRITDGMLKAAALALAHSVRPSDLEQGLLYPPLSELNTICEAIALEVGKCAVSEGVAAETDEKTLKERIKHTMWRPHYPRVNLQT
ncbi:MAG: hypothetical protein IPJ88_10840 [Myxococcales bacterium]|nr:MAG: hypothetical protein IPJ88_10840 [Myxococcales bacterium]